MARSSIDLCRNACKRWSRSYTQQNTDHLATVEPLKTSSTALHSSNLDADLQDSKGLRVGGDGGGGGGITRDLYFPNLNAMTENELNKSSKSTDVMRNNHSQISVNSSDLRTMSSLLTSAVFSASLLEDISLFLSHLDAISLPEQPDESSHDIGAVTSCKDGSKPVDEEMNDVRTSTSMSCVPATKNNEGAGPLTNVAASDHAKKCKEFEKWKFVDASNREDSTRPMSLNLDGFDSDVSTSLSPSPSMSFKNFSVSPTIGKDLFHRLFLSFNQFFSCRI